MEPITKQAVALRVGLSVGAAGLLATEALRSGERTYLTERLRRARGW